MEELFKANKGSLLAFSLVLKPLTSTIGAIIGCKVSKLYTLLINDDAAYMTGSAEEWERICRAATDKLLNEKGWGDAVERHIREGSTVLMIFCDTLTEKKLQQCSDSGLWKAFQEYCRKTDELRNWAWIPNLINLGSYNYADLAKQKLGETIRQDKLEEVFSRLTTPTEELIAHKAQLALLNIVKALQELQLDEQHAFQHEHIQASLDDYLAKYGFLTYYYRGPAMSKEELLAMVKEKMQDNAEKLIAEKKSYPQEIETEQHRLIKAHKVPHATIRMLNEVKRMTYLKAYRKELLVQSQYKARVLLDEIAKRLRTSYDIIRNMLPQEIEKHLLGKPLQEATYKGRFVEVTMRNEEDRVTIEDDAHVIAAIKKSINKKEQFSGILKGQCAYPGAAKGMVKVIDRKEEMPKFNKGDILVSHTTTPDLMPVIEKAAAIVTDVGGLTCHAAIVSREMKKPCVLGTKIATKVLRDGDLVEVDASKGLVMLSQPINQ